MSEEEKRKLDEVYEFIKKLQSPTTIPLDVAEAFKQRIQGT